jgi:selenocysteine lyase/cysteine desulfurase
MGGLAMQRVHEQRLVCLDNAASTQTPQCVLDRMDRYYTEENANIHRGVHVSASARPTRTTARAKESVDSSMLQTGARSSSFAGPLKR